MSAMTPLSVVRDRKIAGACRWTTRVFSFMGLGSAIQFPVFQSNPIDWLAKRFFFLEFPSR